MSDKSSEHGICSRSIFHAAILLSTSKLRSLLRLPYPRCPPHPSVAKQYIDDGHFLPGSMLPKVQAIIEFVEAGGKAGVISDPPHLIDTVEGKTGTWIVS